MEYLGYETLMQVIAIAVAAVLVLRRTDFRNVVSICISLAHAAVLFGVMFLCLELTTLAEPGTFSQAQRGMLFSAIYFACIALYAALPGGYRPVVRATMAASVYGASLCAIELSGALANATGLSWLRMALLVFVIAFALLMLRFHLSRCVELPATGFTLLILSDVMAIAIVFMGQYNMLSGEEGSLLAFYIVLQSGLLVLLLLSYFSMYNISMAVSDRLQLERENSILKSEAEMMRMSERKIAELRELRHDAKNLLEYMEAGEGDASGGEFRERLKRRLQDSVAGIDCGNRVIDSVINMKMAALPEGVTFDTRISVPSRLPFEEMDLCQILCNLIDNATESAERLGLSGAVIGIEICPRQDYLYIGVRNPLPPGADTARMARLETQKGEGHGYGTRIVRRLAEKYNGFASWEAEGDVFIAEAMLDLLWDRKGGAAGGAQAPGAENAGGGKT